MAPAMQNELIQIQVGSVHVEGMLTLSAEAEGIVVFAHGSGSSRLSPRNNYVASELHKAGLGTLLMDLLTPDEDKEYHIRFDIALLAYRLDAAVNWLRVDDLASTYPIGLFGASTGAAAALQVAAEQGANIAAVVSRGGRPDLAGNDALAGVRAPTLLIVGGLDDDVIKLNQEAYGILNCEKQIEIVPGATHLFEEPGKLQAVAELAAEWFVRYL